MNMDIAKIIGYILVTPLIWWVGVILIRSLLPDKLNDDLAAGIAFIALIFPLAFWGVLLISGAYK